MRFRPIDIPIASRYCGRRYIGQRLWERWRNVDGKAGTFLPLTEATYLVPASLAEPRHGYGIMQDVETLSGGRVRLGPGTLNGALTNLLKQKLIRRSGATAVIRPERTRLRGYSWASLFLEF